MTSDELIPAQTLRDLAPIVKEYVATPIHVYTCAFPFLFGLFRNAHTTHTHTHIHTLSLCPPPLCYCCAATTPSQRRSPSAAHPAAAASLATAAAPGAALALPWLLASLPSQPPSPSSSSEAANHRGFQSQARPRVSRTAAKKNNCDIHSSLPLPFAPLFAPSESILFCIGRHIEQAIVSSWAAVCFACC